MTAHIQVVGWNHREYLAACLRSCLRQTLRIPVLYVDNASTDGSAEFVQKEFPDVRVRASVTNRGYSGGHNDGLREISDTEVVVVLNPDVVLEPDFVEKGMAEFVNPIVGAVAPLLLRAESGKLRANEGTAIIDSYGDMLTKSLRGLNNYGGSSLSTFSLLLSTRREPWGFTGAAAFLRRKALEDVAIDGEVFDEDLFAYREDVDLSWRLQRRGWEIVGAPDARATHVRIVRADTEKSPLVARLSWRNYFLTYIKNASGTVLLTHSPWLVLEEVARGLQLLVRPALWPALGEFFRLLPPFLEKRSLAAARAVGDGLTPIPRFPDGRIHYQSLRSPLVLNVVVRWKDKILLLQRSTQVSTYPGQWNTVGGYLDEPWKTVEEKAFEELEEELGLTKDQVVLRKRAEMLYAPDYPLGKIWRVHPVLVDCVGEPSIKLDWEHDTYKWVTPQEVLQHELVPGVSEVLHSLGLA